MTDTDKLKRLAGELKAAHDYDKRYYEPNRLTKKAYEAILALIAENERLKGVNAKRAATIADLVMERDEAVALLRECYESPMEPWHEVGDFLARIDAANNTVA